MKIHRRSIIILTGLILSTGTVVAYDRTQNAITRPKGNNIERLSGTATKKLDKYKNTFLVFDTDNWDGTEYKDIKATHAIIPLHEYCSPNYLEYNAVRLGDLELLDENNHKFYVPLYEEVVDN